jgi:hypothetical protein
MRHTGLCLFTALIFLSGSFTFAAQSNTIGIQDRDYRILTVLPIENRTANRDFNYLTMSLKVMITSDLKDLRKITIDPADIPVPHLKVKPGTRFTNSTNMTRRIAVLENYSLTNLHQSASLSNTANALQADYLVFGHYQPFKNDTWLFHLGLYSQARNLTIYTMSLTNNSKTILENIPQLTSGLLEKLTGEKIKNVIIQSSPTNAEVRRNDSFLGYTPLLVHFWPDAGPLTIAKEGYGTIETDITPDKDLAFMKFDLIEKPPSHYLNIFSEPAGAKVYIEEKYAGLTPLRHFPVDEGQAVIFLAKSNYRNLYRKTDLGLSDVLNFHLMKNPKPNPLFTNKNAAWIFGIAGLVAAGFAIYNDAMAQEDARAYSLSRAQTYADQFAIHQARASDAVYAAIPMVSLTILFTIRYNNEKDW